MDYTVKLIIVDSDALRRMVIRRALADSSAYVEALSSIEELAKAWPRSGAILLHNQSGWIAKLFGAMARDSVWYPVIAYSERPEMSEIVEAILEGAVDYADWPIHCDTFTQTLNRALNRAAQIGTTRLREVMARTRIEKLTPRERQVLSGLVSGLSNRLIGEQLAISPRTVEAHRANMLSKLGASHSSEAIRIALEGDLVNGTVRT